jgi:2-methylcitrate dehydratase PrpD
MDDAATALASAAAATRFKSLPLEVRATYRDYVLDTLAVMAAGAAHPELMRTRRAFSASDGQGKASVVGMPETVPAAVAGFLNGAAMTVLQLQDGHRRARGHPMSHVLPAALAIAEETGASGQAMFDAVVAGYEVCARIGASLGGMQPLLHDTGTFGCIGAAVAAACLLTQGEDESVRVDVLEAAIGNAAAVALFPFRDTCMEGATGHHLFVGLGVQNGIVAARSSLAGLKPSERTLERFFGPRAGECFDLHLLTSGIGRDGQWSTYEIEQAYLKWHPVCAHLGPMLDCFEALRAKVESRPLADITDVRIDVYSTALQYDSSAPSNDLAARFSFRHAAAIALTCGVVRHDAFGTSVLSDPDIQSMAKKIRIEAAPGFDALYPQNRPSRVTIWWNDGTQANEQVLVPRGDGTRRLSRAEVDQKASRLIEAVWPQDAFDDLRDLVDQIIAEPPDALATRMGALMRRPFRL